MPSICMTCKPSGKCISHELAELATDQIRSPNEAFENTQSRLLLLADSEEEEYNLKHSPAHLHKGVMYTVHKILTVIKRLTDFYLQSLRYRFVAWTKPDTTALLLGILTDLARSKSDLVITPRERMPSVSGSSAVYGVSASIICSSCMRSSSTACSTRICTTSTKPGRIKVSSSRFRHQQASN